MPKHNEDSGGIGEKYICGLLGSVRVDSMQRPKKKHRYSLKKHTFCPSARQSAAYKIIVNKIKKQLVSCKKIASPYCGDRYRSRDVRRSHSPVKSKPLEVGGRGRSWCWCFLKVARCGVLWLCVVGSIYRMYVA
jgi:hypothetical protein